MVGHRAPRVRVVVRTVDPGDVHAALDQAADQIGVRRRLRRQGDHDAGLPVGRCRPEQLDGPAAATVRRPSSAPTAAGRGRMPAALEHRQHRGADKPQRGLAHVVRCDPTTTARMPASRRCSSRKSHLPNRPVMHDVSGAGAITGSHGGQPVRPRRFRRLESLEQARPADQAAGRVRGLSARRAPAEADFTR